MDIIKQYKALEKERKIREAPTDLSVDTGVISYKDRRNYTFRSSYKRKYHFGEIFNRVLCQEKNKPSQSEINSIKELLNNDFSMDSIYRKSTYNQRKHLVYIWHILNGKKLPVMTDEICSIRDTIICGLNKFYSSVLKTKAIKYRLVIDVLCEHFGFEKLRPYLYFKNNEKHRIIVREVLKI